MFLKSTICSLSDNTCDDVVGLDKDKDDEDGDVIITDIEVLVVLIMIVVFSLGFEGLSF